MKSESTPSTERFSRQLERLLTVKGGISVGELAMKFGEKGFAVVFLLLMALPALPIPTGGVTHIFELIVMLLALEMIVGRRTVWLPQKWGRYQLPERVRSKGLPVLLRLLRRVERYSRPRQQEVLSSRLFLRGVGFCIFVLTIFAFVAPPFSNLDTLPALGIVLIALGLLLDDIAVSIVGLLAGGVGVVLVITLGRFVFRLL